MRFKARRGTLFPKEAASGQGLGAEYTRTRLPVRLVYFEEYERVSEAWGRERTVHGWIRSKKKKLINTGPGVRVEDDSQLI